MIKNILILLVLSTTHAAAETPDSAIVERTSLWRTTEQPAWMNPAIHKDAFNHSLTQIGIAFDFRHENKPFTQELGESHTLPSVGVNTFLKLSEKTSVWGSAAYMNGTVKNICWNSSSDYELLKPYVLADTIGGDTKKEGYYFSGAYATELKKISLGAEILFRAEHEFRDRDPRMRGIATDLTMRAGAARTWGRQNVGLSFEGNFYKQTNSVDFYNELGISPEYQMTGLGTYYTRFSGDKRRLYFNGGGISIAANTMPKSGNGIFADLLLKQRRYHRVLADFNSMPLTDIYNESVSGNVGWKREGITRTAFFLHADYERRTGDERIGGKSEVNAYPTIGRLTMYKNHATNAYASAIYGKRNWNAQIKAGYVNQQEEYVWPQRALESSHIFGELKGQLFIAPSKPLTLRIDALAATAAGIDDKIDMPFADLSIGTAEYINHRYDFAKASYTTLQLGIRADHKLKDPRYGLFASLNAGTVFCSADATRISLNISIGAAF